MPTYVFLIDDGAGAPDVHELDLLDLHAARLEAARIFGGLIHHAPNEFWAAAHLRLTASDSRGLTLFELAADAVNAPALS